MQRTCDETQWQPSGRPTRWYEWLAILLLFGVAGGAHADQVYKCEDAKNSVAYQSQPCAADQIAKPVEIAPAPQFAPSPQYKVEQPQQNKLPRTSLQMRRERREAEPTAFECRAADGQVFYRHSGCPHSIAGDAPPNNSSKQGSTRDKSGSVSVSSRRVPLDEACRQMRAAGSIGRSGHTHDESVSTYDHNLGRDPCR